MRIYLLIEKNQRNFVNLNRSISYHQTIQSFQLKIENRKTKHYISLVAIRDVIEPSGDPCVPSPCGPYSQCRAVGKTPACSCLPNYIGRAPNCRPECMINAECPANLACINEKCSDPCIGACGVHTSCTVLNHNSVCQCLTGYTGDPFSSCTELLRCKTFVYIIILHTI